MKNLFTFALILLLFRLSGQNTDSINKHILNGNELTLPDCQLLARLNYPLFKQKELLKNVSETRLKNLDINYLPVVNLNGQATVQSDVTKVPISMPGLNIPDVSKDMYKLTLDFNEMIYDGGLTRNQKKLENISNDVEQENIEVELDKIKEKVNQLYFSILILKESEEVIQLGIRELENKMANIESRIRNGTLPAINEDIINVEILKLKSQLGETVNSRKNAVKMLGIYMNLDLADSVKLLIPVCEKQTNDKHRKEFDLFDLQEKKLEISKSLIAVRTMPKFSAFVQLGYGRPGLNMLSNEFDPFAIAGIRLSWNIWNWNLNKNDIRLLNYQKILVDNQRELFKKNQDLLGEKYQSEIDRLAALVSTDREIVALRTKIMVAAASQLSNGSMTSTEYITEQNASLQASLNLKSHELQYIKAMVDYLNHFNWLYLH